MKKLIIFFAILFTCGVFAQNTDKSSTYLGTNDMFHLMYQATLNGLRTIDVSSLSFFAFNDTTNTSYDSLAFGFTARRIILTNRATTSDTLFFAFAVTPDSTNRGFILGDDAPFILLQSKSYIKLKGGATGKHYQVVAE